MNRVTVLCDICRHLREDGSCAAFPAGIPESISEARHDHRVPYPGDRGIRFEVDPAMGPDAVAEVDFVYGRLGRIGAIAPEAEAAQSAPSPSD